jgi:hypothetical protein
MRTGPRSARTACGVPSGPPRYSGGNAQPAPMQRGTFPTSQDGSRRSRRHLPALRGTTEDDHAAVHSWPGRDRSARTRESDPILQPANQLWREGYATGPAIDPDPSDDEGSFVEVRLFVRLNASTVSEGDGARIPLNRPEIISLSRPYSLGGRGGTRDWHASCLGGARIHETACFSLFWLSTQDRMAPMVEGRRTPKQWRTPALRRAKAFTSLGSGSRIATL